MVTNFAGIKGESGSGTTDGTSAQFLAMSGINLMYVADTFNHAI